MRTHKCGRGEAECMIAAHGLLRLKLDSIRALEGEAAAQRYDMKLRAQVQARAMYEQGEKKGSG